MAPGQRALRVVFAEDNFLVRQGTAALLDEVAEVDLVRLAEDPQALLAAVEELAPDAVLTDIRMPPTFTTEGIDAAKRIRREHPGTGVVVLSQYVEPQYAVDLFADGVGGLGYLLKERVRDVDELVRALQDVCRGGSALDAKVVEALLADGPRRARRHWPRSPSGSWRYCGRWPPDAATPPSPGACTSVSARWRSTSVRCSRSSGCRPRVT